MSKLKSGNIAALMMLLWLAVYIAVAELLPKWSSFITIAACTLPMVLIKQKHRGKTFGARDCDVFKYTRREYTLFFALCICGCALLSALTYFLFSDGNSVPIGSSRGFLYPLVFSCMLPAFFEEWLIRGGVLGVLAKYKGLGIWICALLFGAMHDSRSLLYALFAGVLITALVYVTECIYLGMLLHFLNNFASLLLSCLSGGAEYIALTVVMILFAASFVLLRKSKLLADIGKALVAYNSEDKKAVITPLLIAFVIVTRFVF